MKTEVIMSVKILHQAIGMNPDYQNTRTVAAETLAIPEAIADPACRSDSICFWGSLWTFDEDIDRVHSPLWLS